MWPLPAFARTLRFPVAAHPADRLHIITRGFSVVALLLGSVEQRVVTAALLVNHASGVFPAMSGSKALAGSAVFPVRFATPIDCRRAAGNASAQKRGKRYQSSSTTSGRILAYHVHGLLSAPSSATRPEKQGKIARTWDRIENRRCKQNSTRTIER
ncbi:hypothetical protein G9X68_18160 [Rhizobium sp. WYCCWR 11279]|uniref:Uncharacterized protein n=1 Tax=Rhizobium changzhiense TaxID=2692317 RepID=A0A7Z0UHR9_9HYPH|nr:hypothetical protein [Rhizobium changzhiense]MCH4547307.1 hypothetical protein [Rhizobium changzhiense]NNU49013.1 hypothetical protein [Rhizobium changzhiense]NZD65952.1 hypothetical protein [Rhizobium changzhiense]